MIILGIESSCDETSAAVVNNGIIYSNIVASQISVHAEYGGVVPEIASRKHIEAINPVIRKALLDADMKLKSIQGIAVTCGPGLIGSLLIGLSTAKAIAYSLKIPFVGVNHLEGHIAAALLSENIPEPPFVVLVVSGGHTSTFIAKKYNKFILIGQTRDDAAGEAFDKAAKLLNLGYPGGVRIDEISREGNPKAFYFPRAMKGSVDFSFSGLKTSLLMLIRKREQSLKLENIVDIAASYQEAIVDSLIEKTIKVAEKHHVGRIVVCGGVAANGRLRIKFKNETSARKMELFIPPVALCTDNAAMIAAMGEMMLKAGYRDAWNLNSFSRLPIS